ncbi:hypothetical protein B0H10DRAFT_2173316 [Mycena sp. CBHHK59/15]|nr:hypothetical protein B0H10DRAFT_2173316 [Mycena sp. CBHHK59/15]
MLSKPCIRILGLLLALGAANGARKVAPMMYNHLPLGQIQPNGWLTDQLNLQANGLAGNEYDFYNYVAQSNWTGGSSSYSDLNEGGSYWFNGMVAHAFVLNNARLKTQVQTFMDYVLAHQDADGWLGPEPRTLWGRYPFLLGLMQYAEADTTQTSTIVAAMIKFVVLANSMLKDNYAGVEEWGAARWQDFVIVLEVLYDNHPSDQQSILLETMQLLQASGTNWTSVFSPTNFPTGDTGTAGDIQWHGVNLGQALKEQAVAYRFMQSSDAKTNTAQRWDILYRYHGRPSGIFGADEHLAGLAANRGSELCMVVETMYSGSYTYQMFGNNSIADLVEKMAYNALPAELTGDMWQHQYLQQLNQIWAKPLNPNIFATDGDYSNVFGLEPNYPCCAVNHPQGFPKFVSNAFVTTNGGASLVQVYLGPFKVSTTLASGNAVSVFVDTQYPFSDTHTTTITADMAYTHYVRIPEWAKTAGQGTIAVNGGPETAIQPNADSLLPVAVGAGTTTLVLSLPAEIETTRGPTGGLQVNRGPLFWSSDLFHSTTVLATNAQNANATDLEFVVDVGWAYAVDPTTLTFHANANPGKALPAPVFDSQQPPVTITATACPIDWTTKSGSADDPPSSPATCTGNTFEFIYWPYGSTKLRLGELPTFSA